MFVGYPHDIFDDGFGSVESAERIFNDLKKWETTTIFLVGLTKKVRGKEKPFFRSKKFKQK